MNEEIPNSYPNVDIIDINLFAGAGGLAVGLNRAGFSPAFSYELDKHSCETLRQNIDANGSILTGEVYEGDIRDIDWRAFNGRVRLLAAGVPCQPFSLAGKHNGERDERNLFPEIFRAIRELRPSAVLLENVKGLVRYSFRQYFDYIRRQIEVPSIVRRRRETWLDHDKRIWRYQTSIDYRPEYRVSYRLLEAADFGVPQHRQRIFIIATRGDLPVYRFPRPTHSREELRRIQLSDDYWKERGLNKPAELPGNGSPSNNSDGTFPWVTVRDGLSGLSEPVLGENECCDHHWFIGGARVYPGHSGSILDWPSKTIKAGVHGVPGGENLVILDDGTVRYFTLREAARIQTFPDQYNFAGARSQVIRQIGNAVPCKLAEIIAKPIHGLLTSQKQVKKKADV